MRLIELTQISELQGIEDQWLELWNGSDATPFQSPMWLIPSAENFTSSNLQVLAIFDGSSLVAVAPFYSWEETLFLLGNGISDYLDITADEQHREEVKSTLVAWLRERSIEWNQLPQRSLLRGAIEFPGASCPVLDLKNSSVPSGQTEKLRYYRRRAEKLGQIQIESATAENCNEIMENLFQLHALRWSERGQGGVLQSSAVRRFHLVAARRMALADCLRLYRLLVNRSTVGVLHAFANKQTTYFYLSGFDPAFEKISPGTLLIGHAIERAVEESHTAFDFLRGSESYKYSWGAADHPTFRRIILKEPA